MSDLDGLGKLVELYLRMKKFIAGNARLAEE